jgi:hypothetical protein
VKVPPGPWLPILVAVAVWITAALAIWLVLR